MRSFSLIFILCLTIFMLACGSSEPASPLKTLQTYQKAMKQKDTTTMKLLLSADTLKMIEQEAKAQGVTPDDIVKRETLFEEGQKSVEFRNEKIEGTKASIELKNSAGTWETIPFVLEDDQWKIDKKGYADHLMQDIERSNDEQLDKIINQNKPPEARDPQDMQK